jgi:hypothetical protein
MSESEKDRVDAALDSALGTLASDVEPSRDLWPEIRASMAATPTLIARRKPSFGLFTQLAAGFVLVIVSSAMTYLLTRQSMQSDGASVAAAISSADGDAIAAEYLRSRASLDHLFAQRLAALPSATRAKLESTLADLRRAENEIVANLARHPSDSLLHELLMSTYQSEAQLLADVSEIPVANSQRSQS